MSAEPHSPATAPLTHVPRFILAILNRSGGHKREFSLKDISIQHSFAVIERVPSLWVVPFPRLPATTNHIDSSLAIISFGVPLAFLLPISSFVARNAWDVHNAVAGESFTVWW